MNNYEVKKYIYIYIYTYSVKMQLTDRLEENC